MPVDRCVGPGGLRRPSAILPRGAGVGSKTVRRTDCGATSGWSAHASVERGAQRKEPAVAVPGVLDAVGVQERAPRPGRKEPQRQRRAVRRGAGTGPSGGRGSPTARCSACLARRPAPCAAQQIRPRVTAVEGTHLAVRADLQEQDGDELLGDRVVGVAPGRGVLGPRRAPADAGPGPAPASAARRASSGLVVRRPRGSCRARRRRSEGGEPVPADVPHHDPHAVLGGDRPRTGLPRRWPRGPRRAAPPRCSARRRAAAAAEAARSGRPPRPCGPAGVHAAAPRRTCSISPVPTAKKTAQVTIRAPSPSSWASGQASLYVIAAAPQTSAAPLSRRALLSRRADGPQRGRRPGPAQSSACVPSVRRRFSARVRWLTPDWPDGDPQP